MRRLRASWSPPPASLLALVAVFTLLDIGFLQVLNRPFDPMIDWRYAGSLVETVRGSAGGAWGEGLLVAAGGPAPRRCSSCRRSRCCGSPASPTGTGAGRSGGRGPRRPLAGARRAGRAHGVRARWRRTGPPPTSTARSTRVPSVLRDRREFARAAEADPVRDVPAADLLTGLRGQGRARRVRREPGPGRRGGLEHRARGWSRSSTPGTRRLERAGFAARSAFLTSPTFGAGSWLAHATLQSGLWVDSQQRYDLLVTSPRLTLSRLFGAGGVADGRPSVPANNRDWPQGDFYGFDHVYDSRNVGYRGPAVRLPDHARPVHPRRLPPPRAGARRPTAR